MHFLKPSANDGDVWVFIKTVDPQATMGVKSEIVHDWDDLGVLAMDIPCCIYHGNSDRTT